MNKPEKGSDAAMKILTPQEFDARMSTQLAHVFSEEQMRALQNHHACALSGLLWMAIHGNLQLALRHPNNRGQSAAMVRDFVNDLGKKLQEWGVLTAEQLAHALRMESDE